MNGDPLLNSPIDIVVSLILWRKDYCIFQQFLSDSAIWQEIFFHISHLCHIQIASYEDNVAIIIHVADNTILLKKKKVSPYLFISLSDTFANCLSSANYLFWTVIFGIVSLCKNIEPEFFTVSRISPIVTRDTACGMKKSDLARNYDLQFLSSLFKNTVESQMNITVI